jgi:hypothetical protein
MPHESRQRKTERLRELGIERVFCSKEKRALYGFRSRFSVLQRKNGIEAGGLACWMNCLKSGQSRLLQRLEHLVRGHDHGGDLDQLVVLLGREFL